VTSRRTSIWRCAVSQALVLLTAWLSLAPALHGAGHDTDCEPPVFFHDPSQHRIGSAVGGDTSFPTGDHCLACHLFRSSRTTASWKFVPQGLDAYAFLLAFDVDLLATTAAAPVPARAPPVLS
jgi:hypothetical protein